MPEGLVDGSLGERKQVGMAIILTVVPISQGAALTTISKCMETLPAAYSPFLREAVTFNQNPSNLVVLKGALLLRIENLAVLLTPTPPLCHLLTAEGPPSPSTYNIHTFNHK